MKKSKDKLDLEYLNKRIDNLHKKLNSFQDIVYKFKREDQEEIDKLRKDLNSLTIRNNSQDSSNGHIALSKSIARTNEQPLAKGESVGSNPTPGANINIEIARLIQQSILFEAMCNMSLTAGINDIIKFWNKKFNEDT